MTSWPISCWGRAQAESAELLGPDGLLSQVTMAVLERALVEEMTGHLGYERHDPAGRGSGNSRNGMAPKTVLTDVGAVDLAVPRDRNGTPRRCRLNAGTQQMLGTGVSVWRSGPRDYLLSASTRRSTSSSTLPDLGRSR
jgi:Transposase, Mutator family